MPNNAAPYEVIGAPGTAWLAPPDTAFPDVDTEPAGDWAKLGTSGNRNYDDVGITIQHSQSVNKWRPLGATGPVKAFRVSEDMMVKLVMMDVSLEQYAKVLEYGTVTATPASSGVPGTKSLGLSRGFTVNHRALLVRFPSPYGDNFAMQFQIPRVIQSGEPTVVFKNGEPAGIEITFEVMEDPDATGDADRFGKLIAQTAVADT